MRRPPKLARGPDRSEHRVRSADLFFLPLSPVRFLSHPPSFLPPSLPPLHSLHPSLYRSSVTLSFAYGRSHSNWRRHEAEKGPIGPTNFDWTFWNEYDGEVDGPVERAADGEGLPLSLLRRRDAILFFAELPLYEDDLHDKGEVAVSVKVRVMESCFLVLLRTFLRLDADRARLREVRWCHRTGSHRFVKDVQVREADAATVLAHMARTGGAASGGVPDGPAGPAGRPGRAALSPAHGIASSPGVIGTGIGRVHSAGAASTESTVGVHGFAFATPAALPTMPLSGGGLGVRDPSSSASSATAHADAVGGGSGSHKCPMAGRETVAAEVAMDPSARAPWAAGGALDTRRAHGLPPVGGFGAFAPSDARVATGRVWYSAQDVADAVPAKAHRVEEFVWT